MKLFFPTYNSSKMYNRAFRGIRYLLLAKGGWYWVSSKETWGLKELVWLLYKQVSIFYQTMWNIENSFGISIAPMRPTKCIDSNLEALSLVSGRWQLFGPQTPAVRGWNEEDTLTPSRSTTTPCRGCVRWVVWIPFVCFGILILFLWASRWNEVHHHPRNHFWRGHGAYGVWKRSFVL